MEIESFYEPQTGTWTHLLTDPSSGVAAVIDPVWVYDPASGRADESFIDTVLTAAQQAACRIEWVLETHAHADHLTAADRVRQRTGAGIACGSGICTVQRTFAGVFNLPDLPSDGSQFDRLLREGDTLRLGSLNIRVIETPGHTADSITYLVGDAAFVGDTLFAPGYGTARCDFPGGDAASLFDSIQRLHTLPAETRLFLCHDYPGDGVQPVCSVTVAESRARNVHVSENTEKNEFVSMRRKRDAGLGLPRLIYPALQINIRAGAVPAPDSTGVSYLRTPFDVSLAELLGHEVGNTGEPK